MLQKADIVAKNAGLQVRSLAPGFGAEIIGADLSRPFSEETAQAIRDIWIEAGLLLFRDPDADDDAQMRLSMLFGEMEPAATADMNDPNNKFMMTLRHDPASTKPSFQAELPGQLSFRRPGSCRLHSLALVPELHADDCARRRAAHG